MTRFVYVLPAGRFRWEVRAPVPVPDLREAAWDEGQMFLVRKAEVTSAELVLEQAAEPAHFNPYRDMAENEQSLYYRRKAHALIAARAERHTDSHGFNCAGCLQLGLLELLRTEFGDNDVPTATAPDLRESKG